MEKNKTEISIKIIFCADITSFYVFDWKAAG